MLVPVTVLLAASCMKDPMEESLTPGGPALRFAVTQSDGWSTVQSRAAGDAAEDAAEDAVSSDGPRFAGVFTLQGETPADTLFLHATVTDGIGTTDPDDEPDGQQKGVTRAAPLGPNSDFYDAFGVYAYTVPATAGNWQNATKTPYMKNIGVTKGSNWTTNYRWPGSGNKIRFFAYAPHGGQDITPVDNDATRSGTPSLVYAVPSTAAAQKDLLVATSEMLAGDTETEAGLTFTHQLAAIKFAAANDLPNGSLTIKSISLEGINSRGTLAVNAAGSWGWVANSLGTPTPFTHTDINYAVKTNKQREQILPDAQTFMMIPQPFGTDAAIVVTVEEPNVGEQTLRMSLANESAWLPGKTYTYTISSSSVIIREVFEVSIDNNGNYPYTGGARAISVNSYIEVSSPKMNSGTALRKNVPWTVALNNTGSDWVTLGYTQAQLSGGSISFDATVAEQSPNATQETPHENRLRARDPIGQPTGNAPNSNIDNRIDLSTSYTYADGQGDPTQVGHKHLWQARETANCYIVNRPGYYRIPAVYGNAKIGDGDNTAAYLGNTTTNNPFVDHRGNNLTSPWIQVQLGSGSTPAPASRFRARLIWQSSKELITNLFYSEELGCCVCFDIVKDDNLKINNIHQGNALIGLYYVNPTSNAEELAWTWHIWITDYLDLQTYAPDTYNPDLPVSDIDITNKGGVPFTIMSVNLGWVNGPLTIYEARSATATFTQEGGKTQTIPINQQRQSIEHRGHNPFYQWGRQVPLPGIQATEDGTGTQDMEWFDINGSSLGVMDRLNTGYNLPLATVMQNPTTFYYSGSGNGRWTSSLTPRYWNTAHEQVGMPAQNLNMSVQKSIYDPCPRGYRVSDADTYTGMTVSGGAYDLRTNLSAVFDFSKLNTPFRSVEDYNAISGWLFYADPDPKRTQNTVFPMRSTGNRASTSGLLAEQSFGKSANYWTNRMHNTTGSTIPYPAAYSAVVDRRAALPRSSAGNNVTFGLSVRCIRDRVTGRDPAKTVTVNGVTMDLKLVPLHQSYPGGGVN